MMTSYILVIEAVWNGKQNIGQLLSGLEKDWRENKKYKKRRENDKGKKQKKSTTISIKF